MAVTASQAKAKCLAAGCTVRDVDAVEAALPGIDWATLLTLLTTYGPSILAVILALLGKGPLPTPLPAPSPITPTP